MLVWQPVQTARRDLDRYSRWEMNKRAEYLRKNSPLINGLIERLVTLTIGRGIFPTFKSKSKKWNDACKMYWKKFCQRPCVDSIMSMSMYQRIKMRARFAYGESFSVLTYSDRFKTDAIQGLEWFRVSGNNRNAPGVDIYTGVQGKDTSFGDGIDYDAQGFPLRYHLDSFDAIKGAKLDPIDAEFMVHHFTPKRDEQTRGETILSACINTAQDVKEILDFEKQAVKDASSHQDIIQTATGDLDPETMLQLPFNRIPGEVPVNNGLPDDFSNKIKYYNIKFQGSPVVLKTGDKYTPYTPNRPGNAWQGFLAMLCNTIVMTTGFPASVVLPIDIGGTDVRRDLQIAQKVVETYQDDEIECEQRILEYIIMGAVEDRKLPSPPDDWNDVEWHCTGSLTVDRNKDQVRKELVEGGLMTWGDYHGENGEDGDEEEEKIIAEVKRRRFRVCGVSIDKPFASAAEFKQFLNLSTNSSITFRAQSPSPDDDAGLIGQPAPGVPRQPMPQPEPANP
jgi:capsid protein